MSYAAEQALRTNWLMNSCKEPIEDQSKSVIKEQSAPLCFEQITKEQNLDPIHPVRKHFSKKAIKNTILFARALLDEMKMKQQNKQTFKKKKKESVPQGSSERVLYGEQEGAPPSTKANRDQSATIPETLKGKNDKTLLILFLFKTDSFPDSVRP